VSLFAHTTLADWSVKQFSVHAQRLCSSGAETNNVQPVLPMSRSKFPVSITESASKLLLFAGIYP